MLSRLARALNPGGAVLLGAAETVIGLSDALMPHPEHRGVYVAGRTRETAFVPLKVAGR